MSEFDESWDDFDGGYDYEPNPRAFCDVYEAHAAHTYRAINGIFYDCSGMSETELAELNAYYENVGTCEHGMSADLCSGPNHYETYEQEKARYGY